MLKTLEPTGRVRGFAIAACRRLVWLYAIAIVFAWLSLRLGGDRWWWATLLLFGPRWVAAIPLALLAPAAIFLRPRLLWPLTGAGGLLCFAILGLCLPWSRLAKPAQGPVLRALTFNVNQGRGDLPGLDQLIVDARPDVVALQECTERLAPEFLAAPGWHVLRKHNLWLASRYPLEEEQSVIDGGQLGYWGTIAIRCRLETPFGAMHVVAVHLETPREGLDAVLADGWSGRNQMQAEIERRAKISALASQLAGKSQRTLVLGDFNMPVDSAVYRRDWSNFKNSFSLAGWGFGGTKMTRWFQIRIDHVLASGDWKVARSWVGPRIGSDHLPLVADLRAGE